MLTDSDQLSLTLSKQLVSHQKKLVLAESCTGGALSQQLTAIPGASQWFDRAFITYSNASKIELLHVDPAVLEAEGAVSEAVVKEMAEGALKQSHADISLSITGIAGPDGATPEKPVGTVWFGVAQKESLVDTRCHHFSGDRLSVRLLSVQFAVTFLLESLR